MNMNTRILVNILVIDESSDRINYFIYDYIFSNLQKCYSSNGILLQSKVLFRRTIFPYGNICRVFSAEILAFNGANLCPIHQHGYHAETTQIKGHVTYVRTKTTWNIPHYGKNAYFGAEYECFLY